ncbi:MAG: hypothetical protein FJX52_12355, partial [Alphaproteobacteria bacterium]|nr:hypothetical protein [Alphaproteobacteria bacterium]
MPACLQCIDRAMQGRVVMTNFPGGTIQYLKLSARPTVCNTSVCAVHFHAARRGYLMLRNVKNALILSIFLTVGTVAMAQELKIGMQGEPGTMDPQFNLLGTNTSALRNIFDTLSIRDQNLQLKPGLALSWRSIDETTWEYKLRPGVRFHDGAPFTAADVKFTIERVPNVPQNPNSYVVYTNQIKEVVVVDPLTIHFKTDGPAPLLPTNLSNIFIISSAKGVQSPAEFNSGRAAIGTGPYKFLSWQPGSPFVIERNDSYWGGKADWSKVTFVPITRDASRVASLLSGDVDFINVVPIAD